MKAIRYGVHFIALAVAVVIFWFAKDLRLPKNLGWVTYADFFHYALMGALHASSLVVSLRDWGATSRAVGFIAIAALISGATPEMALLGSVIWFPFSDILRENNLGVDSIFITGSAIGAYFYGLLVKRLWLKSLRRADLLRTVALCVVATLLILVTMHIFDGYKRGVISLMFTAAWWFAFSISLYWSEMGRQSDEPTRRAR